MKALNAKTGWLLDEAESLRPCCIEVAKMEGKAGFSGLFWRKNTANLDGRRCFSSGLIWLTLGLRVV
jgi:hypothetical protein